MTDTSLPITQTSANPASQSKKDEPVDNETYMRRFREFITAGLAFVIVILYPVGVVILAIYGTSEKTNLLANLKDLVLLINPMLGFVLGYYFTKTSTENRAENAESTAKAAVAGAQQAALERAQAEQDAIAARGKVQQARTEIDAVGAAIEKLAAQPTGGDTLSAADAQLQNHTIMQAMEACKRAKRALE